MARFKIYRTNVFEKELWKLSAADQTEIAKFEQRLAENPYVGKPLGYTFLREKKLKDKRIYYLVYADFILALLVAISTKKDQQATIDAIKANLGTFYHQMREQCSKSSRE